MRDRPLSSLWHSSPSIMAQPVRIVGLDESARMNASAMDY